MRAYTQGSAWINRDHEGGRIRPGARADLVLLDSDPFALASDDLHAVGVELTLAAGRAVYERTAICG